MPADLLPDFVWDALGPVRAAAGFVLRTGVEATLIALLVLATQHALRHRVSARWRHNLWFLVLARLVLPTVPAAVSPFNLMPPLASSSAGDMSRKVPPVPPPAEPVAHQP